MNTEIEIEVEYRRVEKMRFSVDHMEIPNGKMVEEILSRLMRYVHSGELDNEKAVLLSVRIVDTEAENVMKDLKAQLLRQVIGDDQ